MVPGLRVPRPDASVTVLSFVATVVMLQNFYSVFTGSVLPFPSSETAAAEYAELWYRVLSARPETDSRGSEVAMASVSETREDAGLCSC